MAIVRHMNGRKSWRNQDMTLIVCGLQLILAKDLDGREPPHSILAAQVAMDVSIHSAKTDNPFHGLRCFCPLQWQYVEVDFR